MKQLVVPFSMETTEKIAKKKRKLCLQPVSCRSTCAFLSWVTRLLRCKHAVPGESALIQSTLHVRACDRLSFSSNTIFSHVCCSSIGKWENSNENCVHTFFIVQIISLQKEQSLSLWGIIDAPTCAGTFIFCHQYFHINHKTWIEFLCRLKIYMTISFLF